MQWNTRLLLLVTLARLPAWVAIGGRKVLSKALILVVLSITFTAAFADSNSLGKDLPDGSPITIGGVSVTAVFPGLDRIYVEKSDRSGGIRVDIPGSYTEGAVVSLTGTVRTDPATRERYIAPPLASLGANSDLNGNRPFPADNPWNKPVDKDPVDPNSAALIASIGTATGLHPDFGANWNGGPFGIPYVVVSGTQAKVPVTFDYADESDPGPYPIPPNAPIEGGAGSTGDRHVIVIDRDNWKLYELYAAYPGSPGWTAGSGAIFDLNSNALRPAGWTSADAAGLPIFPGLVRYDEVVLRHEIRHALRFTVQTSRKAYVSPARHYASSNTSPNLPPMGMRVRLKSTFDITHYSANNQVILKALKTYGMIVADNGSNWYISGAPDARWNDDELSALKQVHGSDFEVVKMGTVVTQ